MWRVDYRELHEGYRVARFNEVFKRKIHLHSNSNIILSINCSKHTTDSFSSQQMLGFKYTRKESPQKTEFTEEVMGLTSTYFFFPISKVLWALSTLYLKGISKMVRSMPSACTNRVTEWVCYWKEDSFKALEIQFLSCKNTYLILRSSYINCCFLVACIIWHWSVGLREIQFLLFQKI